MSASLFRPKRVFIGITLFFVVLIISIRPLLWQLTKNWIEENPMLLSGSMAIEENAGIEAGVRTDRLSEPEMQELFNAISEARSYAPSHEPFELLATVRCSQPSSVLVTIKRSEDKWMANVVREGLFPGGLYIKRVVGPEIREWFLRTHREAPPGS